MAQGIAHLTHLVEKLQVDLTAALCQLQMLNERINHMPTRADFDAAKGQLQQAIGDAANRVAADIQALRDAIAAGNPVTDADLQDIQSDITALGQIDPAVVPTPAPTP